MTERTTLLKSAPTAVRELISADGSARVVRTWAVEPQEHFGRTAGVPITEQVAVSGQAAQSGVERHPAPVTRADNTTPAQFQEPMLFTETTAPYVSGSRTSEAAAASVQGKTNARRGIVLDFIRSRGELGACDFEGEHVLGWTGSSYCPRRIELQRAKLIRLTDRTRKTASGHDAGVWVAV